MARSARGIRGGWRLPARATTPRSACTSRSASIGTTACRRSRAARATMGAPLTGRTRYSIRLTVPSLPLVKGQFTAYVFLMDAGGLQVFDRRILPDILEVIAPAYRAGLVSVAHRWDEQVDEREPVEEEVQNRSPLTPRVIELGHQPRRDRREGRVDQRQIVRFRLPGGSRDRRGCNPPRRPGRTTRGRERARRARGRTRAPRRRPRALPA